MSWQDYERGQLKLFSENVAEGFLRTSKAWNPAATAATQGAEVTTTVDVPGAVPGDPVTVGHTAALGAATLHAAVTAPGVVTVRLVNTTAVAVDLANGTLTVVVLRPLELNT